MSEQEITVSWRIVGDTEVNSRAPGLVVASGSSEGFFRRSKVLSPYNLSRGFFLFLRWWRRRWIFLLLLGRRSRMLRGRGLRLGLLLSRRRRCLLPRRRRRLLWTGLRLNL